MKGKHFPKHKKIRILDAACGTGAVLKVVLDAIPKSMHKRLRVVANDVSEASKTATMETMKQYDRRCGGKVSIEYTKMDITQDLPKGKFDIILCPQVLCLIGDENVLRAERLGLSYPNKAWHTMAKMGAVGALARKAKSLVGELWVIDEHEMKLTQSAETFDEIVDETLFNELFRKIDKDELVNQMKLMPGLKFVGHLETHIDSDHFMYFIASTSIDLKKLKKQNQMKHIQNQLQNGSGNDEFTIRRRMEEIHPILIERLRTFNEKDPTAYRPIAANHGQILTIDMAHYRDKIEGRNAYWQKNGSYNLVVLSGLAHELGIEELGSMIEKIRRSKKAEEGAAILVIDQWPAPLSSNSRVSNGDLRRMLNNIRDLVFCGAVRQGDKYGYLYIVKQPDAGELSFGPLSPSQAQY